MHVLWNRNKKSRLIAGILLATLAALVFSPQFTGFGSSDREAEEVDPGFFAIIDPETANAERRQDPQVVEQETLAIFSLLLAEEANEIRRSDPEVAAEEAAAMFAILNPEISQEVRRADPEEVRQEEQAMEGILHPKKYGD